jgi:hypothetical protein
MSICPTSGEGARHARGSVGMRPLEILKCRASKMPFPAFWGENFLPVAGEERREN